MSALWRKSWVSAHCGVDGRALVGACQAREPAMQTEGLQIRRVTMVGKWASVGLGQIISVLITFTGIFSTRLSSEGIHVPIAQSSLNYVALSFLLVPALPRLWREGLDAPAWHYMLWAVCDVEANYCLVKAYQYTSITSVMLLDCFAIPVAMLVSRYLLQAQYGAWHFAAVCICMIGLIMDLCSDLQTGPALNNSTRGSAWVGDLLVIMGATMYGVSNVMQEKLVKRTSGGQQETLGILGALGTITSAVQVLLFERSALARISWSDSAVMNIFGFQACLFGMYLLAAKFLSIADAAVFNLSTLTSDIYSVIYAWGVQQTRPSWTYAVALGTTLSGLILYHSMPRPTNGEHQSILARASLTFSDA